MPEDFYPGAPDEETRLRCQALTDRFIEDLIAMLGADSSKKAVIAHVKKTIDSFDHEDTEERERVDDYVGEIMEFVGITDWMDQISASS